VSINSERENHFIWRLCGTGTDNPILHPLLLKRDSCWIGLTEKYGNENTIQARQKWVWPDGTSTESFSKWHKNSQGGYTHSEYDEPYNGREGPDHTEATDERHAIMNDRAGGFSGKWYDRPASFRALPVCEMAPRTAGGVVSHDHHAGTVEAFPSIAIVRRSSLRGSRSLSP